MSKTPPPEMMPDPSRRETGQHSVLIFQDKVVERYSALYRQLMQLGQDSATETPAAGAAPPGDDELAFFHQCVGRQPDTGKYVSHRQFNSGGMGNLHYVFDQDFQRYSAMKVILPELKEDPDLFRSFVREAQITAQLEHPNIVPVHDVGYEPGYGIFFTMKYVKGETLNEILEEIELGTAEFLEKYDFHAMLDIFRKVCDAAAFAHSQGVLHRDIKPHNIMVGDYGEVLLMDWGLAKRFGQSVGGSEDETELTIMPPTGTFEPGKTRAGVLKGSPGYMSPEQARGDNDQLDQRSDVFLLGATLYHMFTFFPPYMGNEIEEVVASARESVYLPPESVSFGRMQMPAELCRIMAKAMAPEQADRYQTVAEMAEDIDALIRGKMDFRTTWFAPGEFLIREGDVGKEFYIVVKGQVEVFKEHGGNKVQLGTVGEGDIVGEMAMITHETRSASVVALEPTEVMVLTDEVFAQNLKKMPPWMERTFVVLAERLQEADNRLAGK